MSDVSQDIIPAYLFDPVRKGEALAFIERLLAPPKTKARLLKVWGFWTGATLEREDFERVEKTGIDAPPNYQIPHA